MSFLLFKLLAQYGKKKLALKSSIEQPQNASGLILQIYLHKIQLIHLKKNLDIINF